MIEDPTTGSYLPFSIDHLLQFIPRLSKLKVDIDIKSFDEPLDSAHIGPEEWLQIKDFVEGSYHDYDGFVVLHGTDTMAYSASALGFLLQNLSKPVIFTGSQLPISRIRSDAQENLITAIEIAAAQKDGVPTVPEVAILFDSNLYRGVRSTKVNAENFDAFQSPNYAVLAKAGVRIQYLKNNIKPFEAGKEVCLNSICKEVGLVRLFPGMSDAFFEAILSSNLKGIVLETFGTGTVNLSKAQINSLKKAIDNGLYAVAISQCNVGAIEFGRYEASNILKELGVISGEDITKEAALTKMMVVLGNYSEPEEINSLLSSNWLGEITER